jgi:hypothetical protein
MWADAFLSAALAVVCAIASPIVGVLGLARGVLFALGLTAIGVALLLAGFGAVTAFLLAHRLHTGVVLLPPRLRLPLPAAMRPSSDS